MFNTCDYIIPGSETSFTYYSNVESTVESAYDFNVLYRENELIINQVLLSYMFIGDIIHLHIYPFILFMIIRNINRNYFNIFIKNIILIASSHIYFMTILSKELVVINKTTYTSRAIQSVKYILILEFLGYWYHRIAHTPYFYNKIHTHDYPYDYLLCSRADVLSRILYTYVPLSIIPMTYVDFMVIYYIYIFIGFLSDTNIFIRIHRHSKKYNYSVGIPLFDYCFGTYLSKEQFTDLIPST